MVKMNVEHIFAQVTRLRFWVIVGAIALIALHPEWIKGAFRKDLTTWDTVLGIIEGGCALAGFCVLFFGFPSRDRLAQLIGLVVGGGGLLLLWLTFG